MGKLTSKLAKAVGTMMDQKTASLDNMDLLVSVGSGLHPVELGTMSQAFLNGWKSGGDGLAITVTKKNRQAEQALVNKPNDQKTASEMRSSAVAYYKVDGTINVNGKPMDYLTAGTYSLIEDADNSPKKVEITTTTGEKSSFTINLSSKKLKVLSINGQQDKISIDPTKDVTVELDTDIPENALIKISIAMTQMGMKEFVDVCFIRSGSKITIPAAAFRNIALKPDSKFLYNYKKSYLQIVYETLENATDISGPITNIKYRCMLNAGKFINVTAEPELNLGLVSKHDSKKDNENVERMDHSFYKASAFYSRPFEQMKKIGVTSFSIRGTTYKEYTSTTETQTTITTTHVTLQFPPTPNEVWDAMLEKLYPDLMDVVKQELSTEIIPIETILNSPSYAAMESYSNDDKNTKVEIDRSYRGAKVVSAFMPLSEGFGVNSVNERIMNETGADALMTMTIDLELSAEPVGNLMRMTPKFAFEISGRTNGSLANTKYCNGSIQSTTGVVVKKDITPEELEKIVRKLELLTVFRRGLKELVEKEKANGDYPIVWNIQK